MRIDFDESHDTVYIRLRELPKTNESDEIEPGVIVDYGPSGEVVGFELLDARQRGPWADWIGWVDKLQTRASHK